MSYVPSCIEMAQKGCLCRGRPFVEFNNMSKRYDFAYIKKGFRTSFEQRWRLMHKEAPTPAIAPASGVVATPALTMAAGPSGGAPPPASALGSKGGKKNKAAEVVVAAAPPGKKPKVETLTSPNDKDSEAKKKARKDLTSMWAKANSLHSRVATALSTVHQMQNYANLDKKTWGWAEVEELPKLRASVSILTNESSRSSFWKDFFITTIEDLKKKHAKEANLVTELGAMHGITEKVEVIEKLIGKINALHKIHTTFG